MVTLRTSHHAHLLAIAELDSSLDDGVVVRHVAPVLRRSHATHAPQLCRATLVSLLTHITASLITIYVTITHCSHCI